jgi:hypothetical protein
VRYVGFPSNQKRSSNTIRKLFMEQRMSLLKVHQRSSHILTRHHPPSIHMLLRVDLQRESKNQVVAAYAS